MTGYEVPKPPYSKSIDDCRPEIQRFARSLWQGTDDSDPESRGTSSTVRYINDLRWLDEWLDASGNELSEMEVLDAETLMMDLSDTFNGSTPRQRWDQIMACCAYLARRDILDTNPLEVIDEEKADRGLTNTTEQSRQLGEEERYAVSQEEVRLMEDAVSSHRVRNQCIIRLMWQTGVRVGEVGMLSKCTHSRRNR